MTAMVTPMVHQFIYTGEAQQRLLVLLTDTATGLGKTGVTALTVYAYTDFNSSVATTSCTVQSGNLGTWTRHKFNEVDATSMPGLYSVCWEPSIEPLVDLPQSSRVMSVRVVAAGCNEWWAQMQITSLDFRDSVTGGLSALAEEELITTQASWVMGGHVAFSESVTRDGIHGSFYMNTVDPSTNLTITYPLTLTPGRYKLRFWCKPDCTYGYPTVTISGVIDAFYVMRVIDLFWTEISYTFNVPTAATGLIIDLPPGAVGVFGRAVTNVSLRRSDEVTLSEDHSDLASALAAVDAAISSASTGLVDTNVRVRAVATAVGLVYTEASEANTKVDTLLTNLADLDGDVATVSGKVDSVASDIAAVDSSISALPASVDAALTASHGAGTWDTDGPGVNEKTVTLTDQAGNPIPDAYVWITATEDGPEVESGCTNSLGQFTFHINDDVTYYFSAQKDGYNLPSKEELSL